jgi:5'(3')-deoxyribonucleotidase
MTKKPVDIDYDKVLEPELLNFLERVEDLESEAVVNSSSLQMREIDWDNQISELRRHLVLLKVQVQDLKAKVTSQKELFVNVVNEFRQKASAEDMQKVNRRLDDMKFEQYMTRDEFQRKLKGRLE